MKFKKKKEENYKREVKAHWSFYKYAIKHCVCIIYIYTGHALCMWNVLKRQLHAHLFPLTAFQPKATYLTVKWILL